MILERLDNDVITLLSEIENMGFHLCIVGGAVRDALFEDRLGIDLDFELRVKEKSIQGKAWEEKIKELRAFFRSKKLQMDEHPYLITSIRMGEWDLEFSSPRTEEPIPEDKSHHHFKAILDPHLSYEASFARRDLTVNAIGVEFDVHKKSEKLVDPYHGKEHLDKKILSHINDYFFEDNVRFLRIVRFHLTLPGFSINPETKANFYKFDLRQLSVYHLKKELIKSKCVGPFLNVLEKEIALAKLEMDPKFASLFSHEWPTSVKTIEQLIGAAYLKNEQDAKKIIALFSIPEKVLKDAKSFIGSYQLVEKLTVEELKHKANDDLETNKDFWREIKNLHEKREWFVLSKLLSQSNFDWNVFVEKEEKTFSAEELSAYPSHLRSLVRYQQKMKKEFT